MTQAAVKEDLELSGASAILESLVELGVKTIFGYPGGTIMPTYDALYYYRDKIRHVLVRHEQGGIHAAEGYARVTGKAGVCMVTSGPGATNLVTGIADAMMDSCPVVCICGQVGKKLLGSDAFQETDVIGITIPITKWNYQITSADEIPWVLAKAFAIAEGGRPGPVVIDITKNAQIERVPYVSPKRAFCRQKLTPKISRFDVQAAAKLINEAKRPMILAGHGILISDACETLRTFAEKSSAPVACTLQGLSCIPTTHPLYVGLLGMHGNYGPNILTNQADLLIAAGMRFDDRVTGALEKYAPNAKVVHIDIDAAEIDKNVKATVSLVSDAKVALEALLPLIETREYPAWMEEFSRCRAEEFEKVIDADINSSSEALKMSRVIHRLSEATNGDAVIVTDVGQHQMMAARYFKYTHPHTWVSSGGLGTMGYGVPAAMGVALAGEKRPVIAIVGDGGFQMTCQELGTIAQENLPVKIMILNNQFLGMVRQWQELFYEGRYSFVELDNPDFVKLAEAFRIKGERVLVATELDGALSRMLSFNGPYLLDIAVEKETNVFPMVPAGAGVSDIRLS